MSLFSLLVLGTQTEAWQVKFGPTAGLPWKNISAEMLLCEIQ